MTDKTTEALNQAEKMAKRHGVRMCDEERCQWWWDTFKIVVVPVYEESK